MSFLQIAYVLRSKRGVSVAFPVHTYLLSSERKKEFYVLLNLLRLNLVVIVQFPGLTYLLSYKHTKRLIYC